MNKKLGPLPVRMWLLVAAGTVAAYLLYRHFQNTASSAATTASTSAIDPTTGLPYSSETGSSAIDPTTGIPYAQELAASAAGTGSTTSSTVTPTLSQEISDVTGIISALQGLPAFSSTAQQPLITVPGGSTLYDPNTGVSVTAPAPAAPVPATTAPQVPTTSTPVVPSAPKSPLAGLHLNNIAGNPRQGQYYTKVQNPTGHPAGYYHVYGSGRNALYQKVTKTEF